jgi:hypothetical protein
MTDSTPFQAADLDLRRTLTRAQHTLTDRELAEFSDLLRLVGLHGLGQAAVLEAERILARETPA